MASNATPEPTPNQLSSFPATSRTRLRRHPERGHYERQAVYGILDEALLCHVAFVADGQPYATPMAYGRIEDRLYLHGAAANRTLRCLASGAEACVTVTLLDGLVLGRSAFHHSVNYRSAVILGRAAELTDAAEKLAGLRAIVEHVFPERWKDARAPSAKELARTLVLALPIDEASAKLRTGPPIDEEEDYALPVWAGVIPLGLAVGKPLADPRLSSGVPTPAYALDYRRPGGTE